MSKFTTPQEELVLTIEVEGKKKKVKAAADKYYLLDRGENSVQVPVLKHDTLVNIADANGCKIDRTELEFGAFNSASNFCFIHRSYGTLSSGVVIDEVGEANPNNLDPGIGSSYPAIMSNKRSQDRLLIRLMGLTGQVYSDVEFGGKEDDNSSKNSKPLTQAPASSSASSVPADTANDNEAGAGTEIEKMTIDEVKALVVDYGAFKKNPITLGELKETQPDAIDWLVNGYKVNKNSSEKMRKLHEGAKKLMKG